MLSVKLELHNARTGAPVPERLGELRIVNTGEGTEKRGVYRVTLRTEPDDEGAYTVEQAFIEDWPRLNHGPWELVSEALAALGRGG